MAISLPFLTRKLAAAESVVADGFRPMQKPDLRQVVRIEGRGYNYPWSRGIFNDCIRAGYHCRVLQLEQRIAAYGILMIGAGEAHILNICVAPDQQGQGLARRMLRHLLNLAAEDQVETVFLEVRPSNMIALHVYRSEGFCEVGTRPNYYPAKKGREDALVMAKTLGN